MRKFLNNLISAIIGGAVVFFGMNYAVISPPTKPVKYAARTQRVSEPNTKTAVLGAREIYEKYSDAVIHVRATATSSYETFFGLPIPDNRVASGSGFIVSDKGYVVTNAHVVQGADNIKISFSDGAEVPAKLVGVDQSTDVAILKADLSGHRHKVLRLGNSENLKVGEPVYAIGNPLGLDRSMSSGIISALERKIEAPNGFPIRGVIQTDAAINPGNSGGPLISATGKVIGVTAQIATDGGTGNIGIAFAIPSSTVKKVFDQISKTGKASHAWIGIQGANLTPELAKFLKLNINEGALVVSVLRPGPATGSGLRGSDQTVKLGPAVYRVGGDIITKLNKHKITSMDDLVREINAFSAGDAIKLTVIGADNKKRIVKIKLGNRPDDLNTYKKIDR